MTRSGLTQVQVKRETRAKLVSAHLRLVVSIAKKYTHRGYPSWISSRKAVPVSCVPLKPSTIGFLHHQKFSRGLIKLPGLG